MAIVKCGRGHFYDTAKYDACPMCNNHSVESDDSVTVGFFAARPNGSDDEKTIGINFKKAGNCDPVVGWLVCVDGPEKGRDFRLHTGRNFIGRDYGNDICLMNDKSIGRKNDGCIIYEPHKNEFLIMNNESANIYVNGEAVMRPYKITEDDEVKIGAYTFAFVAYCKGEKKW